VRAKNAKRSQFAAASPESSKFSEVWLASFPYLVEGGSKIGRCAGQIYEESVIYPAGMCVAVFEHGRCIA
jgi:hypothetical protein